MYVTIAWHGRYSLLECPARLAAELGYLIRVWEGSDCYGSYRALLMAEWMIAFVWGRARCRGQAHDCVICARQLFGDNTVLPHYESHTVNLTKSYSLGLGPGEGGCKGP